MVVLPCLVFTFSVLALPISEYNNGILGLFGGDGDSSSALHPPNPTSTALISTAFVRSSGSVFGAPSSSTSHSSAKQWIPTSAAPAGSPGPTSQTTPPSTPSTSPASAEGHANDHSSKTWQIIGIAIIAVLFVATSITCAMFIDRLWILLKDVLCCTSRPHHSEEFIPDCEKRTCDTGTLSPSPPDRKGKSFSEGAPVHSIRARELPWNTDTRDWNTFHRQPSQRNDRPPA